MTEQEQQEWNRPENEFKRRSISENFVTVSLWIHDKPERVFCNHETITSATIIEYAADLAASLAKLAETLATLEKDGWESQPVGYCVDLYHAEVNTARQARARLKRLGLNPKDFMIQDQ